MTYRFTTVRVANTVMSQHTKLQCSRHLTKKLKMQPPMLHLWEKQHTKKKQCCIPWRLGFEFSVLWLYLGCTNFPKSRSHLKILRIRRLTWSKLRTENPQIWGTTVQNLVTMVTWCPGFVHLWTMSCKSKSQCSGQAYITNLKHFIHQHYGFQTRIKKNSSRSCHDTLSLIL